MAFVAGLTRRFVGKSPKATAASPTAGATSRLDSPLVVRARSKSRRLDVRLVHGSILDVSAPACVLGIFDSVNPTGAARAVDAQLGGTLSTLVQARMFGGRTGEISLLPIPRQLANTDTIAFAGLGPIDSFKPRVLEMVAENLARVFSVAGIHSFATVPIGANAGCTPEQSLESLLRGLLTGLGRSDPHHEFTTLQVCELDGARSAELWAKLESLAGANGFAEQVELVISYSAVEPSVRVSPPPPVDAVDLTYLQVAQPDRSAPRYSYSVLTAGSGAVNQTYQADVEPQEKTELTRRLDRAHPFDEEFGRQICNLYIPTGLRETVVKSLRRSPRGHLVVVHDRNCADIPWEAMYFDNWSPALEGGVSRKLQVPGVVTTRSNLPRETRLRMLVIYNPTEDLDGANDEGDFLTRLFEKNRGDVTVIARAEATRDKVLEILGNGNYDILHYAGHADFDEQSGSGGILCSDKMLVASDLDRISNVPQLVVLNGCESGRLRSQRIDRAKRAPSEQLTESLGASTTLAEALLYRGVMNFVGTYWPVNDAAALCFAGVFHNSLLGGDPLGLAIQKARKEIQQSATPRDWANYLHFGDPEYRLRRA
jgi:hypothetical protein